MFVDSHGNPVVVGDVYLGKDNRWYEIAGFKPELAGSRHAGRL